MDLEWVASVAASALQAPAATVDRVDMAEEQVA